MPYLQVENITKIFTHSPVLDSISFTVDQGDCFGLLGPNGSGKSTCLSILSSLVRPSSGRVLLDGKDIQGDPLAVRRQLAYVFQDSVLDRKVSVENNLNFIGALHGLSKREINERKAHYFQILQIPSLQHELLSSLSGGMRRLVELVGALLANPKLLFLDEPTSGLDLSHRKLFWSALETLRRQMPLTIVFTTHYLEEALSCNRVALISHGKMRVCDTPANLIAEMAPYLLEVVGVDLENYWPQSPFARVPMLKHGDKWTIQLQKYHDFDELAKILGERMISMEIHKPTMNDVFLWKTQCTHTQ